eukprot:TRINITY_DN2578_c0_g1_i2.p2 TRINITY_DN2578_c0_g1~~TRINITY_DN2578_c0_g1_i2.p2  ORF type:complete len:121 (-),score=25.54 TRINITY_DN2578_c0_g1_i2:96-458(-)
MSASYYRGAHGIILCYDVTNTESFEAVSKWLEEIQRNAQPDVFCLLVGNKTDLEDERVVTFEQGQEVAKHYKLEFVETSAKSNVNVEEAFLKMAISTLEIQQANGGPTTRPDAYLLRANK